MRKTTAVLATLLVMVLCAVGRSIGERNSKEFRQREEAAQLAAQEPAVEEVVREGLRDSVEKEPFIKLSATVKSRLIDCVVGKLKEGSGIAKLAQNGTLGLLMQMYADDCTSQLAFGYDEWTDDGARLSVISCAARERYESHYCECLIREGRQLTKNASELAACRDTPIKRLTEGQSQVRAKLEKACRGRN